ncbi:uncharacterized protein DC041_0010374 [Schistosoma bovis]|uniref:Endothelin-converting enzyme n=1 Tax=Schistosoma bovis TaxID=6184 RepID=A0A430QCQ7_SCHBO|nr:uncharacterized protein DC041_0010374 [Schistosoma bovis]
MIELLSVLLCVISEFVGTDETTRITETPDTATNTLEETMQNNTDNSRISDHCTDFYETACGEWEKQNPLSGDSASSSVMQQMGMNVDNYFWKIIANDSYYKEDWRLQSARAFYKSCVNSRNSNTTRESRHHLIDMYFGGWQLIPSLSTEINNTNGRNQSQMNNSLTDLFLPILTQTGRSPLFSMNIAEDIFAVIISPGQFAFQTDLQKTDMDKSEEDYYKLAFETGVPQSQKPQLTDAFRKMIRLGRIDWSYALEKVLQETGYVNYHKLPIIIERRNELRQRCAEYRELLTEKDGGRSPLELPIFTTRAYYNMNANRVYVNAGVLQPPLYYENGSLASKFGALGWIISHEIMHGIGIQGVLFDSAGTSLTGLTGLMLSSVIETKTSCIIDQYRLYEFTDYKALQTDTRDEILADIGGLKASYYALQTDTRDEILADIGGLKASYYVSKMGIFALYSNQNASQQKENLSTVFQYPIREDNYYTNEFYIRKAKYIDTLKTQLHSYYPSLIGSPAFLATAYYSAGANRVYVYSGFLQPPLYYENGSLASKFGALGWIISHEIMHGIGIQGVLYDENWNKRTSYDALMSSTLIHLKTVCLSHQYVSYNYTHLKAFRTDTQEEMLADNDGLKASYHINPIYVSYGSNNI